MLPTKGKLSQSDDPTSNAFFANLTPVLTLLSISACSTFVYKIPVLAALYESI